LITGSSVDDHGDVGKSLPRRDCQKVKDILDVGSQIPVNRDSKHGD
jgi:hypothetical protein